MAKKSEDVVMNEELELSEATEGTKKASKEKKVLQKNQMKWMMLQKKNSSRN